MEIINAAEGVAIALSLAALVVSPNAIATYLELRADERASETGE